MQCPDLQIYGWKPEPEQGNAVRLDCHAEGDSKTEVCVVTCNTH